MRWEIVFKEKYLWKCSWAHVVISMAETHQFAVKSWHPIPMFNLVHRDFSRFSESVEGIMNSRLWLIIAFALLRLFWHCSTIYRCSFCRSVNLCQSSPLRNSQMLFLHPPIDLLPVKLICYKVFQQLFLFDTTYFSSLLLTPVPTFFEQSCYHQIQSKLIFFLKW